MKPTTKKVWDLQLRTEGDRWRLFTAVGRVVRAERVLYPGSFVDIAPSFVFPHVTYVDLDRRAPAFFEDQAGVRALIAQHPGAPTDGSFEFVHGDYTQPLDLPSARFDLLVSLYSGFISEHCFDHLKVGGTLLVNPSHGDVEMAAMEPRYTLTAAIVEQEGDFNVVTDALDTFLIPKTQRPRSREKLREARRGVAYTKPAFAYLFRREA